MLYPAELQARRGHLIEAARVAATTHRTVDGTLTSMAPPPTPPDRARSPGRFRRLAGAALRLRCPVCLRGRLSSGWFRMVKICPACGLHLEREEGYFLGAMYITFLSTYLPAIALYVLGSLLFGWTNRLFIAALIAAAILVPLLTWQWPRAAWLALDQFLDPRSPPAEPPR